MFFRLRFIAIFFVAAACNLGSAQTSPTLKNFENLDALLRLIKPQEDESQWAKVPWLTNLKEARERAVAEDKPLFFWRSGGGDVLGRT